MNKNKKLIIYFLIFIVIMLGLFNYLDISIQDIISFTPNNKILAAIVILIIYTIKCLTIFFPLVVIEIATGYLFELPIAIIINLVGLITILTIPYFIGRKYPDILTYLKQKYPKIEKIINIQNNNSIFICFFTRVISILPGDIVTMCYGINKTPYHHNLIGGLLGLVPSMIIFTILGNSITKHNYQLIIISIMLTIIESITSLLIYYFYKKRQH